MRVFGQITSSESVQPERSVPVTHVILIKQLNKYRSFCNGADDGAAQTTPPSVSTERRYEKQAAKLNSTAAAKRKRLSVNCYCTDDITLSCNMQRFHNKTTTNKQEEVS